MDNPDRCDACGRPVIRPHRHGGGSSVVYGRWAAAEERRTIRRVYRDARDRDDRRR